MNINPPYSEMADTGASISPMNLSDDEESTDSDCFTAAR